MTTAEGILQADLAIDQARVKIRRVRDTLSEEIEKLINAQRDLIKALGDLDE